MPLACEASALPYELQPHIFKLQDARLVNISLIQILLFSGFEGRVERSRISVAAESLLEGF